MKKKITLFKTLLPVVILLVVGNGVAWGQLTESFETGLPSNYSSILSDALLNSGTWQVKEVMAGVNGVQTGTKSAQIRNNLAAQIITPTLSGGVGTISFWVIATTDYGKYEVNISTDNGATWSATTGSPFDIGITKTQRTITVNNANVNKVQFYHKSATLYIDDVSITTAPIPAPTTQASAINFTSIGQTGITANWTNGEGAKRVVIMNTSNSFTTPADGTDPTANTFFGGSGEQVVYNGTGTSIAVTGLTASTIYHFRVYEYNGNGATTKYFADAATNNPNSQATTTLTLEPTNHPTSFTATTNSSSQITVTWTDASVGQAPNGYLVKASTGTPTAPVDGTSEADASFVKNITQGTQSAVFTGLTASTLYNFSIWPYTNSGTAINFKIGSEPTANATTITAVPTVLQAGDIAFIGFATDTPDRFAFITFVNINANTQITFTDNGWKSDNTWRTGESIGIWTAPAGGVTVGTVIEINSTTVTGGGTISVGLTGMSNSGDQLIAYQGVSSTPTFITAINMNWVVWQPDASDSNKSKIPTGLTSNINANAVMNENGYYNGITSGTVNFLKSAINNPANWTSTNSGPQIWKNWSFSFGNQTTNNTNTTIKDLTIANDETLTVDADKQLTITGALTNNGTINLLSDANGTATLKTDAITGSGTSKVQQYLTNQSWYLTSPVNGTVTPTNLSRIQSYIEGDGVGNTWSATGTTMTAGKGYITSVSSAPNTIEFTGTINSGNISIPLMRQAATDANKYGFNLIGNPYTAYLDWKLVSAANASKMPTSTMWYRTKASGAWDFSTVNGAGETSPANVSYLIPPMQAFWVRASTVGNSNLELTTAMVALDNNSTNKLKAPAATQTERTKLRLQVSNGTNTDELLIYTDAQASNAFDWYDSPKMSNESVDKPEISCVLGNESLVINGLNSLILDTALPLRFMTKTANAFTLKANQIINLPEGVKVILSDYGTEFDLTTGAVFNFTSDITDHSNRFSITFRTPGAVTGFAKILDNRFMVYSHNNRITLKVNEEKLIGTEVSVYNAIGQKIISEQLNSSVMQFDNSFKPDVYLVKVNNITKKVIVK